jgi:hypothetical protein
MYDLGLPQSLQRLCERLLNFGLFWLLTINDLRAI